jgi:hypothetical protein
MYWLITALSLSIGWGIRGNFGHEYGAMIAGALAAIAMVLFSGRTDWYPRVAYFATLGAIGWSFGGSISYMQVIAYTHSGDSLSVVYGFACLFVIGFCWAAPGGFGTALPACLNRERLTELFPPMIAVFAAWLGEELFLEPYLRANGFNLNWFDTDWLGALIALVTALLWALIRWNFTRGTALVVYMAAGWWVGFGVLVLLFGLRMTPPRGDNWAGVLGLVGGLLVYCWRYDLPELALSTIVTGILGGVSFAGASMFKLVEVTSGLNTNWHSVLEQSTGAFNGLAVATAMAMLARRTPEIVDEPRSHRYTEVFSVGFVLLGITYLNLRKNPISWIKNHHMASIMYGLPLRLWFDIGYALLAIAIIVPLIRHLKRPVEIIPNSTVGKGQLLYLAFLWWMVVGNFDRALIGFAEQRLVTEGVIHANAAFCSLLILLCAGGRRPVVGEVPPIKQTLRKTFLICTIVAATSIVLDWAIVRAIYGDKHAGHSTLHIRFGPRSTVKTGPK